MDISIAQKQVVRSSVRHGRFPANDGYVPPVQIPQPDLGRLMRLQKGGCAICHATRVRLTFDHEHRTGLIRGKLCHDCNRNVGRYESGYTWRAEFIQWVKRIGGVEKCLAYINNPPAKQLGLNYPYIAGPSYYRKEPA